MGLFTLSRFRDLRRAPRTDVDHLAHIDLNDDAPPLNCIIADISANGAKLTIGARHEVPDEVTLTFRRRCRVVRRGDGQIGVEFV
jgi:PilZ domain